MNKQIIFKKQTIKNTEPNWLKMVKILEKSFTQRSACTKNLSLKKQFTWHFYSILILGNSQGWKIIAIEKIHLNSRVIAASIIVQSEQISQFWVIG